MKIKTGSETYYDLEKVKVPEYSEELYFGIKQKPNGKWIAEDTGGTGIMASGKTQKQVIVTMKKCYSESFKMKKINNSLE